MSLTWIDVDPELLSDAMHLSGARSQEEAVNTALREYVARHRRIAALEPFADPASGSGEGIGDKHAVCMPSSFHERDDDRPGARRARRGGGNPQGTGLAQGAVPDRLPA
ncbi:type II toxin-antitoxin system VapB family antitoxin [Nocardiopsis sediminis]|uniref:Type II toxin-antitoxin system VapB family antitoxin n=1 Tax=Nocardiopsis sediminis TaxID=1778267 RepID=A0ABV8FS99_9ACTN